MMDEENRELLAAVSAASVVGVAAGMSRGIFRYTTVGGFIRGLVASVTVAVMVGLGLGDFGLARSKQLLVIAICAFVADDILLALLEIGRLFRNDPLGTVQRIWSAIRGVPTPPSTPK